MPCASLVQFQTFPQFEQVTLISYHKLPLEVPPVSKAVFYTAEQTTAKRKGKSKAPLGLCNLFHGSLDPGFYSSPTHLFIQFISHLFPTGLKEALTQKLTVPSV